MKTLDLYFYLAKRDKQGIRILAKFVSRPQSLTRITDDNINDLFIPLNYLVDIKQKIYDSRLLWEPWVETIDTFDNFKSLMYKRGFANVPLSPNPEVISDANVLNNKLKNQVSMLRKI